MSESDIDVDKLGKLSLDYFEKDSSGSDVSSTASSPHSSDYFESPLSSPEARNFPEPIPGSWFTYPEEKPSEKSSSRKRKGTKGLGVKETVLKRNERERKRVKLISEGFSTLRQHVLAQPSNRKLPKLEILRRAIDYIKEMQRMLQESDMQLKLEDYSPSSCELRGDQAPIRHLLTDESRDTCSTAMYAGECATNYYAGVKAVALATPPGPWGHGYRE